MSDFLLIAHRGGLYYRPENTLAAYEYMASMAVKWVECDVRLSRDGVPVLHHNDRVHVPGSGYRAIRDIEYKQLHSIDVGGGETIPALRELFERFGDSLYFDIEPKELDVVERVIPLVNEFGFGERTILTSFIPEALQVAGELAPELKRGLLVDRLTASLVDRRSTVKAAHLLGCEFILPYFRSLRADWVRAARSEGLKVVPWTVNSLGDAAKMIGLRVQGLVSDRPDRIRELVDDRLDRG